MVVIMQTPSSAGGIGVGLAIGDTGDGKPTDAEAGAEDEDEDSCGRFPTAQHPPADRAALHAEECVEGGMHGATKSEIRMSKSETNTKPQIQNPKRKTCARKEASSLKNIFRERGRLLH